MLTENNLSLSFALFSLMLEYSFEAASSWSIKETGFSCFDSHSHCKYPLWIRGIWYFWVRN